MLLEKQMFGTPEQVAEKRPANQPWKPFFLQVFSIINCLPLKKALLL